jgi:cAMP-dependent protein kinase regulator
MADDDTEDRPPRKGARDRRISVSAEAMDPADGDPSSTRDAGGAARVVHAKTEGQRARIAAAVRGNFLFGRLDPSLYAELVDAMFERQVAKGEELIKQVSALHTHKERQRERETYT